jgi:AsmA protein
MRRAAIAAAGLLALFVAAAILLPLLIDVERFRPFIEEQARQATGRKVSLGRLSLRLLPAPALAVDSVRVADGPLLPDRDALQIRRASIRLALAALLRGRPEVRSIVLESPLLVLFRDAQGRWNYDDLLARAAAAPPPTGAATDPRDGGESVRVGSATIRGGTIRLYDDAIVPGRRLELEIGPIDATVRGWGAGRETQVALAAGLGGSALEAEAILASGGGTGEARIRIAPSRLRCADLATLLPWVGVAPVPGLEVGGEVEIEGEAGVPLQDPGAIGFAGQVRLRGVSYRDAGMSRPLSDLSGTLRVDGNRAVWERFSATLGESTLTGGIQVEDFKHPRVGFALEAERLDVDAIAAALTAGAPAGRPDAAGAPAPGEGMLARVSGRGTLAFGEVLFQSFRLSGLKASVGLQDGVAALQELQAALYGGTLTGSLSVDLRGASPRYRLEAGLERLDVDPLLTDYDRDLAGLLRGMLSGTLSIEAGGEAMGDLVASARGGGSLDLVDGSLRSFSVLAQIAALLEMAGGRGIGREETPFEYLRGGFTIADARARTGDLVLHSADLDLDGEGWIGLDATLDLAVAARFSGEVTRGMVEETSSLARFTDRDGRLTVHLRMEGDLADPRFGLDARRQTDQLKEREKDRLGEKLRDKLRDLLGGDGPEEKRE